MGLRENATSREIRTQFRILSMIYHPDKYSPSILDISAIEAQAHFQLLNNAYSYLRNAN
jgi:curved DNA-binding protein CbpA